MLGTGLLAVVLSCPCSVCLHSLGTSHQAGEDGSSGEHTYLPELPIVDQLRPVSVDQGTETKAILPTVQRERERDKQADASDVHYAILWSTIWRRGEKGRFLPATFPGIGVMLLGVVGSRGEPATSTLPSLRPRALAHWSGNLGWAFLP